MTNTSERKLPLFEVTAAYTERGSQGRTHYINVGAVWESEKGAVLSLSSKPCGDVGDWDGRTFIAFPVRGNEPAAKAFCGKAIESEKGKKLPILTFKAIYSSDRKKRFVECGRAFVANEEGRMVITIDAEPRGDIGEWDGVSYTGFLTEAKEAKTKTPAKETSK